MRESPTTYLQAFNDFAAAQALFQDARRNYRADRERYERLQQDYLVKGARVAVIAKKLGIKPLGGFTPQLPIPLGASS